MAESDDGRMCSVCRATWLASQHPGGCPYRAQHAAVLIECVKAGVIRR